MKVSVKSLRAVVALVVILGSGPLVAASAPDASDPWEGLNKRIFVFNQYFDDYFMGPVARGYVRVVPTPAQTGVRNFFNNLTDVTVLLNNVLQRKFENAVSDTGRLLINTTVGLGGLLDVATGAGFAANEEDFGQTLGTWGVGPGPYMVLPFLGPSSLRDTVGFTVDTYTGPLNYSDNVRLRNSLYALDVVDTRVRAMEMEGLMYGDEYLFMRDAYLQQREYLVNDGEIADDDWDDWSWDE